MSPGVHRPPLWNLLLEGEEYTARLVVDCLVSETSSGGVRIAEEVSEQEVRTLAREMSYKYAFFRLRRGGAKAGIELAASGAVREHALLEVGSRLGSVIRKGIYYPGMDMGCSEADLRLIYRGAGIELGRVTDTSFFTALSVRDTLLSCADRLEGGDRPLTLAIAGLGRVATHLLRLLPESRFRVMTFSTVEGARLADRGFSFSRLTEGRAQFGDSLAVRMEVGEGVPSPEVLRAPVDILIPSARTRDIHEGNEGEIKARAIVPIANAPVSNEAAKRLQGRGILYIPGFVANGGGVYASGLFDRGVATPTIDALCARYHRAMVDCLLEASASRGVAPGQIAEHVAESHLEAATIPHSARSSSRLARVLRGRIRIGDSAKAAVKRFTSSMESLCAELAEADG